MSVDRWTNAFGLSFALSGVLSSILVVVKELNHGVFQWMASLTGHHWVTHGVFQLVLFVALGMLLLPMPPMTASRLAALITGALVSGALIIIGFFLFHIAVFACAR